jgi:nucleoid DNA-binding protein
MATVKKKVAVKPLKSIDKVYNNTEIARYLSTYCDIDLKTAKSVLAELTNLMELHLGKKGPGIFKIAGLFKASKVLKPATKARKGRNPLTGEEMMFKAKPASKKVKIQALKNLKELVKKG